MVRRRGRRNNFRQPNNNNNHPRDLENDERQAPPVNNDQQRQAADLEAEGENGTPIGNGEPTGGVRANNGANRNFRRQGQGHFNQVINF